MIGVIRHGLWADVPEGDWEDWHWQTAHRLSSADELSKIVELTPEELEACRLGHFRMGITPYVASLIDPADRHCPIRRQVIPLVGGAVDKGSFSDHLGEEEHSPVPGLVHRYPDRVLMLVTNQCAGYCSFCTRSRIFNDGIHYSRRDHDRQIDYIARTPAVRDVLLSGGDPLTLPDTVLEDLLRRVRAIEHVEIIRIGTRVPIFLPHRITPALVETLRRYHPLWMNIHVNHAKELTPRAADALAMLADAGIPLGSQTALLAGVNDSVDVVRELVHKLVMNRVRPYYLFQCDMVEGAEHFRAPVSKGIEIIESLRGHTSGLAVPTFAVDIPGGGGKVPVGPQYLVSQAPGRSVLRNFEGYIGTCEEPLDYSGETPARPVGPKRGRGAGQEGVAGLLAGHADALKPAGFDEAHDR